MIKNNITLPFDDIEIVSLEYLIEFSVTIKNIIFYKKSHGLKMVWFLSS